MTIFKEWEIARKLSFERTALLFIAICVFSLYALVLSQPTSASIKFEQLTKKNADPTDDLKKIFAKIGYQLDSVRAHRQVPRIFLASVPKDFAALSKPSERKALFIMMTLPLVLNVNEKILLDRAKLKRLELKKSTGQPFTIIDRNLLKKLSDRYGAVGLNIRGLLKRADIIPPSLALAQSAEESGWGTSRFAHEGNALFGQRTWQSAKGLVPKKREEGKNFKIRTFVDLLEGVRAYALNLNTNPFYKNFRAMRAKMRQSDQGKIDSVNLAQTLLRYSERGSDYVATIRNIIRDNNFTIFDEVKLLDKGARSPLTLQNINSGPDA